MDKLIEELRTPSQWCCIFEHDGHMRHGASDAPNRAATALERAVEALTFYAAKGNYGVRKVVSGVRYSDADLDGGSKARETLSLINGVEP